MIQYNCSHEPEPEEEEYVNEEVEVTPPPTPTAAAPAAESNNGAAAVSEGATEVERNSGAAAKRFSHATLAEKVELMSIIKRVDPNNVSGNIELFTLPLISLERRKGYKLSFHLSSLSISRKTERL